MITKQDLNEWHQSEVTKAIIEEIKRAQQECSEQSTLKATADETAMATAKKEGYMEGISAFLDAYDYTLDEVE